MLGNRVAIWVLVSMAWVWSLAAAEPPELESTPHEAVEKPVAGRLEEPVSGVVIEDIPNDSELLKAGLQVGDVILSWQRLPNPPANPEATQGDFASYFDWWDFEVEEAPRGPSVLRGLRGGQPLELAVKPGMVDARARPFLKQDLEKIYLKGREHLISGNPADAAREWSSLEAALQGHAGRDLRAWIALQIAEAWDAQGEWEKGREWIRAALEVAETPSARVAAWQALGDAHANRNEFADAERAYTSALEITQKTRPASLSLAICMNDLSSLAWSQRALERARDYMLLVQEIQERVAPRSLSAATTENNLGLLAQVLGELDRAREYHARALQIREELAPNSHDVANSLNNLGSIAWDQGNLGDARESFLRAKKILERFPPETGSLVEVLGNLGAVLTAQGEYDRGSALFIQALNLEMKVNPESLSVSTLLNNLGHIAVARGDLERAEDFHSRGIEIEKKLAPESREVALSLSNLGALARRRGALDRAQDLQVQALTMQERIGAKDLDVATSLNNLGSLARLRGKLDLSYKYHIRALSIQERLAPRSLDTAISLNNLGDVARLRGELDRAIDYDSRALDIQQEVAPQSAVVAISLRNLGKTARSRGELDRARGYYNQALEALEHQIPKLGGSYNVQAGFRTQYAEYYNEMLDLLLAQNRFLDAFHVTERFRAQTFLAMLAERDTAFTADIPEELDRERRRVGVLYDRAWKKLMRLDPQVDSREIKDTRRELQQLDDQAGDIEARIRSASPRLAALRYPQPLDTTAAKKALGPGTLLVSFSVGRVRTTVFVLSRGEALEVKTLSVGEEALRTRIKQLLSLLQEAEEGSSVGELRKPRIEAVGRELYAALLGPMENRIAASERLLILPDGPLHALPFAALVRDTKEGPQSLAVWKPLHVALSATVYAELKQRRQPSSDQDALKAPLQLAAFGDPIYPQNLKAPKNPPTDVLPAQAATGAGRGDPTVRGAAERGLFDFQPLPYTRREVLGIASLFPAGATRTFLGSEALEERIKSLDPETRILHLAAHGSMDEHLPSGSFIALTIPEEVLSDDTGPQRDNGLLQVWEIFERVRLNADLVVLSACETGLGEELGGEGLIGLTRAFQYAGARSVLASLWNVQDQATSELMIRFYKHLRAGLPKDQALQAAQQELIRGPIEVINEKGEREIRDLSSPYYWAGFQLYGDWQ